LPEPDLNSLRHRLIDAAVLEFGSAETLVASGAMSPAYARLCRCAACHGLHTRAKSRLLAMAKFVQYRKNL
jgi:hypothetical protein